MTSPSRPTRCEIDLDALSFNLISSKQFIGSDVSVMAVVKANAYGHGMELCAAELETSGADWFGVAIPEEGVELRKAGIQRPILVLGGFWSGQESLILDYDLTPAISTEDQLSRLGAAVSASGRGPKAIHVKVDTGMLRIGVHWTEFNRMVATLKASRHLLVEGLMTHFAAADDLSEIAFTELQMTRLDECLQKLAAAGIVPEIVDLANSPGAVAHPASRRKLVRLGGILYGLGGDVLPKGIDTPSLRPVMAVTSHIALIKSVAIGESVGYGRSFIADKPMTIAAVPIGYADGYPREFSNRGEMLVRERRARVVGRVSMDWTMIDVTDIPDVSPGDRVTVIGQDGEQRITAEGLAADTGTISYEITCGFSGRVPRVARTT